MGKTVSLLGDGHEDRLRFPEVKIGIDPTIKCESHEVP